MKSGLFKKIAENQFLYIDGDAPYLLTSSPLAIKSHMNHHELLINIQVGKGEKK